MKKNNIFSFSFKGGVIFIGNQTLICKAVFANDYLYQLFFALFHAVNIFFQFRRETQTLRRTASAACRRRSWRRARSSSACTAVAAAARVSHVIGKGSSSGSAGPGSSSGYIQTMPRDFKGEVGGFSRVIVFIFFFFSIMI